MKAEIFVKELSSITLENVFNPYSDRCDVYDRFDAPKKRKNLLKKILNAASMVEIDSLWIGRDLGYKGGRRTGLALTDEQHLLDYSKKWGIEVSRFTKGDPFTERTATVIWNILSQISNPVFLWNVFPLHPHYVGNPFSNRAHNSKERVIGEELLSLLISYLKPNKIIAIGNDAENVAMRVFSHNKVIKIRHPSYGGQKDFINQTKKIYHLI